MSEFVELPEDYVHTEALPGETPEEFVVRFVAAQSDDGLRSDREALQRGKMLMASTKRMLEAGEITEMQYAIANLVFPPQYAQRWEPAIDAEFKKRGLE